MKTSTLICVFLVATLFVVTSLADDDLAGGNFSFNLIFQETCRKYNLLSYDVASESKITPCNKIDKPPVVNSFSGNVMTSMTTLRT